MQKNEKCGDRTIWFSVDEMLLTLTVEKFVCQICAFDCNHLLLCSYSMLVYISQFITSAKELMFFGCLCVCDRHNCQKQMDGFGRNFACGSHFGQGRTG